MSTSNASNGNSDISGRTPNLQEETDPGPGTTSDFTPDLDGMGAPYGIRRYIVATAYDANGAKNIKTIWLIVWRKTNLPNMIGDMTGPHYDSENESYNVVVGESFTSDAWTTVLFDRVEWFIMDPAVWELETPENKFVNPVHVTDGPDRTASFPHTFSQGEGGEGRSLESGRKYHIVARAFSFRDPTNQDDAAVYEIPIHVHEGKKKNILTEEGDDGGLRLSIDMNIHWMWIFRADSNLDGNEDAWGCSVNWTHGIRYYNETPGDTAHLYAYVKLYEVDEDGNGLEISTEFAADEAGNRNEPHLRWYLDVTYDGVRRETFYRTMRADWWPMNETRPPARLREEMQYYLYGSTVVTPSDDDKENWPNGESPGSESYTTETREFKLDGAPDLFWVEGYNSTQN
ncbi:MAG: hypothetical protein OXT69_03470 [Candidatus Poribacteria bacterium]|nr:hypothetical protein [Candidatus Poribacteria bacterium]